MLLNKTVQLPEKLDCLRLAEQGMTVEGKIALQHIQSISDMILNPEEELNVTLVFGRDSQGFCFVNGCLNASLLVLCQRCLQPLRLNINSECMLSPITKPFEAEALPTPYEPIMLEEGRWLNTYALMAEEILLNLPYVPKHEEACCQVSGGADEADDKTVSTGDQKTLNPFHDLVDKLNK
jgi:uncharacterized protein